MSINIWTDSMQHAALLGKPVLFTNWLIQRDIIPDGWYCYDLRGTHKSPSTRTTLVDHAADYHAGTVLSPIPLKHEGIVFNTCTQEYEEVIVTEEVYRAYCRTRWNIKDNDQSFFDHEIQTSGMIGSQDGAYENFREFIDAINTPEHIILEQIKKEALYQAISALPAADQALVQGLFFKGQSELDYAREIGVSQPAVHKRKVRILKSLKKLLEN